MASNSLQLTAVVAGAFLSGAMSSLCFIAVPAMLDATPDANGLRAQWARLYHYGHHVLPISAVGTGLMHGIVSIERAWQGFPWFLSFLAGITTVSIAPFTWAFMLGTNNELFGLGEKPLASSERPRVKDLVVKWTWLHLARSVLPLIGATIGLYSYLSQ